MSNQSCHHRTHEPADGLPPSTSGTYLLVIRLAQDAELTIGRLGTWAFRRGWYIYVGSAHGPGGLRARLARHHRTNKKLHWHIDYLLTEAKLCTSYWLESPRELECACAHAIDKAFYPRIIAPRFGASDCQCPTHLFYLPRCPASAEVIRGLGKLAPFLHQTTSTAFGRITSS